MKYLAVRGELVAGKGEWVQFDTQDDAIEHAVGRNPSATNFDELFRVVEWEGKHRQDVWQDIESAERIAKDLISAIQVKNESGRPHPRWVIEILFATEFKMSLHFSRWQKFIDKLSIEATGLAFASLKARIKAENEAFSADDSGRSPFRKKFI